MRTQPRNHGQGSIEQALDRAYERLGSRLILVCVWGALAVTPPLALATILWASRYLSLSGADVGLLVAFVLPGSFLTVALGLATARQTLAVALSWADGGRTPERAPMVWNAVVRAPYATARGVAFAGVVLIPATVAGWVAAAGEPAYTALPVTGAAAVGITAGIFLGLATAELIMRPMVADVAAFLPADFEPETSAWKLRTKALAPLPVVTLFGALTAGALIDADAGGAVRLSLALGIGVATAALAGVAFAVLTRSVLDPLDDLLAATRRVGAGDITTRVPLVTADDFGRLARGFNTMLDDLQAARARIVTAADEERRRVERDLHDGAQQLLVLLQLKLGVLATRVERDPETKALADDAREDLIAALGALRDLAHGIYPAVLENEGLPAALREAVEAVPLPAELTCEGTHRYPREFEAAVFFCCLEALQNASKHAGASAKVAVSLSEGADHLVFEVADDGRGFDPGRVARSAGMQNMLDRVGALGGTLEADSVPGKGARVVGRIPVTRR
jgi:signal transduction histidine kinase